MSTLRCEDCKKGMRVKLTDPDPDYSIGVNNPAVGSIHECSGVIRHVEGGSINVAWDNERQNNYKNGELSSSCEGICVSIW